MKTILLIFEIIVLLTIIGYLVINGDKPTNNLTNLLSLICADIIILIYIQVTKKHKHGKV
jgi:hypothetical protein